MNKRTKSVVGAVSAVGVAVAGAAAGYAAGVLTAPASGKQTRQRLGRAIGEKTADLKHNARKTITRARNAMSDTMASAARRAKLRAV